MQMRRHESEVNKLRQQEIRHNNNIILEKEKFDKKEKDNQKKIMQKYVKIYWLKLEGF